MKALIITLWVLLLVMTGCDNMNESKKYCGEVLYKGYEAPTSVIKVSKMLNISY